MCRCSAVADDESHCREASNGPRDEAPSVLTELSQSPVTTVSATHDHTLIATENHERRLTAECTSTCYGKPCDEWLSGDYSCSGIESWGCDCTTSGCACAPTFAPTVTGCACAPVPTFAPTVTGMPTTTTTAPPTRRPTTLAPTEACDGIELSSGSEWVAASDEKIGTLMTHANYELSFEMKITGGTVSGQSGVLLFIGDDSHDKFDQLTAIHFMEGTYNLYVEQSCQQDDDKSDGVCVTEPTDAGFQEGGTYNISIRDSANALSLYVDDELISETSSSATRVMDCAAVYVGDPESGHDANLKLRNIQYRFFSADAPCPTQAPTLSQLPISPPTRSPTQLPTPLPSPIPTIPPTPLPTQIPTPSPTQATAFAIAPELLSLSTVKPADANGKIYLVNMNDETLSGTISLRPSVAVSCSITPGNFSVDAGQLVQIEILAHSAGQLPSDYGLTFDVAGETPNSLPSNQTFTAQLSVYAKAIGNMTQVHISGSPTVDGDWNGIAIYPFDSDGLAIPTNGNGEDFSVTLSSPDGFSSSCAVDWNLDDAHYEGKCSTPLATEAGDWNLAISLDDKVVSSSMVHMNCADGDYEDTESEECKMCPRGTTCPVGTTLSSMEINKGYWRSGNFPMKLCNQLVGVAADVFCPIVPLGDSSDDVRVCGLVADVSCPSGGQAMTRAKCSEGEGDNPYCACGYVGPLCSSCAQNHFALWSGRGGCKACERGESHTPTILLGLLVFMGALIFAATCVKKVKRSFPKIKLIYRVGSVKLRVLFFAAQGLEVLSTATLESPVIVSAIKRAPFCSVLCSAATQLFQSLQRYRTTLALASTPSLLRHSQLVRFMPWSGVWSV